MDPKRSQGIREFLIWAHNIRSYCVARLSKDDWQETGGLDVLSPEERQRLKEGTWKRDAKA